LAGICSTAVLRINVDIVRAIAALGKSLSLELVAEGGETDSELALVKSSGCKFVQGYRRANAFDFLN
jgi:EAL domain-containing protein (putative c-di-GMP-specific phosphodiesterase class I)